MTSNTLLRTFRNGALVAALGLSAPAFVAAQAPSDQGGAAHGQCDHQGRRGHHGHHGRDGGHGGERFMRGSLSQLDLTANQQAQVDAILATARERRQELSREDRSDATRREMRALRAETKRLIEEVLTPAQRAQAEASRQQRHEERLERRIEHMTEALSLTGDQAARIRAIFERTGAERRALHEGDGTRESKRAAMRTLHESTRRDVDAVLTPAQREQAAQQRESHRGRRHGRHHGPRGDR
jgi:Spy/CpxP family protein refolding chaperone